MFPSSSTARNPASRERYIWAVVVGIVALWGVHQAKQAAYQAGALSAHTAIKKQEAYFAANTPLQASELLEGWVKPENKLLVSQSPTRSLAHNLLPDLGYVTAFHYGGFSNQIVSLIRLAYFAKKTDRILIVPDFWPERHQGTEPPFTEFFDLDRWAGLTNVSMLNWQDVKQKQPPVPEPSYEKLSCWGQEPPNAPLGRYNVETTFWPIAQMYKTPRITFDSLRLMLSQDQSKWLESTKPLGPRLDSTPAYPNEQLVCFDNGFWMESLLFQHGKIDRTYGIEEFPPYGPVWKEIGQHLHFNKRVEREVDRLLNIILPDAGDHPQFIGLHFRQREFLTNGRVTHDLIGDFTLEIKKIRTRLAKETGRSYADKLPVIVATDSDDPIFLARLKSKGWLRVQHEVYGTKKQLGAWWPEVLDGAILSRAVGLVGTKLSTMSYLQARRVESWQGGVSVTVA